MKNDIKLGTPIMGMSLSEIRSICRYGMEYCINQLGVNGRYKNELTFSIRTERRVVGKYMGEYDPYDNQIIIYRNNIKTVGELIEVFIHEYTHSLQPIKTKYHKMLMEYGYNDHPFEIEANMNGKYLYKKMFKGYKKRFGGLGK